MPDGIRCEERDKVGNIVSLAGLCSRERNLPPRLLCGITHTLSRIVVDVVGTLGRDRARTRASTRTLCGVSSKESIWAGSTCPAFLVA